MPRASSTASCAFASRPSATPRTPIGWRPSAGFSTPTGPSWKAGRRRRRSIEHGGWTTHALFRDRARWRSGCSVREARRGRYVDRGLSRNAVFRDRLGNISSRRATVSSPLRHGALAYLSKKLASVSGHSRCGAVAQLVALAGGPLTPAGGQPARVGGGSARAGGALPGVQLPTAGPEGAQ